jgi:hypothetical protein
MWLEKWAERAAESCRRQRRDPLVPVDLIVARELAERGDAAPPWLVARARALRDGLREARRLLPQEEEEEAGLHTGASGVDCTGCRAACFGVVALGPSGEAHCARCLQDDPGMHGRDAWVVRVWVEELKRLDAGVGGGWRRARQGDDGEKKNAEK